MKKDLNLLKKTLSTASDGLLKGGFTSIRGGLSLTREAANNDGTCPGNNKLTCHNDGTCSGDNGGGCQNDGYCDQADNNRQCSNVGACYA